MSLIRDDAVERTRLRRDRRYRSRLRAIPALIEQLENRCLLSHVSSSGLGRDIAAGRATAARHRVELSKITAGRDKHSKVTSPVIAGYTPDQIRAAYGLPTLAGLKASWSGAGQTIAIVMAYNDPYLVADLSAFDAEFKLIAPPSFQVLNQGGAAAPLPSLATALPGQSISAWDEEVSLDVEWAHSIAPGAGIDVVEANSTSVRDLDAAVVTAAGLPGVSVVSMSWDTFEWPGETSQDVTFNTPAGHEGVTFVVAAGDFGSFATYPASSPNVLAVGGTTLNLNRAGAGGHKVVYGSETAWGLGGGGLSAYEPAPAYQSSFVGSGGHRVTPDVSFDANPATGVAIDDAMGVNETTGQAASGWTEVGGTSIGAPAWAALIAISDGMRADFGQPTLDGPSQTLPALYGLPSSDFHRIGGFYNDSTGLGSPVANRLIPALAAYDTSARSMKDVSRTTRSDTARVPR